jgi:predicted MPP superfamily phosphohydrolase
MPHPPNSSHVLLLLGLMAAALAAYAVIVAPRRLRRIEIDVPVPGLHPAFEGYTIGVLSDLHHAWHPGSDQIRRAVRLVMDASPDLIALLGDYCVSFKYSPRASRVFYRPAMRSLRPLLRRLAAPDGVVGILGNHDYYYDAPTVEEWLRSCGVRVLRNEHVEIERAGARLAVAGMDDVMEGQPDPMAGCATLPRHDPRVVLCHNPDGVMKLSRKLRPVLVLSGHTHGGQISLPWYGAPLRWARVTGRKTAAGWVPNPVAPLFVSAGVGSQVPIRLGTTPDVVIVRLRGNESPKVRSTDC